MCLVACRWPSDPRLSSRPNSVYWVLANAPRDGDGTAWVGGSAGDRDHDVGCDPDSTIKLLQGSSGDTTDAMRMVFPRYTPFSGKPPAAPSPSPEPVIKPIPAKRGGRMHGSHAVNVSVTVHSTALSLAGDDHRDNRLALPHLTLFPRRKKKPSPPEDSLPGWQKATPTKCRPHILPAPHAARPTRRRRSRPQTISEYIRSTHSPARKALPQNVSERPGNVPKRSTPKPPSSIVAFSRTTCRPFTPLRPGDLPSTCRAIPRERFTCSARAAICNFFRTVAPTIEIRLTAMNLPPASLLP